MTGSLDIIIYPATTQAALTAEAEPVTDRHAPAIIRHAGPSAEIAWEEFFQGELANPHTHKN
jgi:hypothetical protein